MTTIFAISSGRPPAAIAVLRVSGPEALAATTMLAGPLPLAREARVRVLRDAAGLVLDRALVLVFPGPASATGEDLVELHCHGGRAVAAAVEHALAAYPGLRMAEPGEFTRRALTNGRIDLAQAEGLADLLAAETERQRIAAIEAAEGRVSRSVRGWLDAIALLAARIEATLDFSDEADVDDEDVARIRRDMQALAGDISVCVAGPTTERLRDGISVVLAGPPNSGKSTLINLLGDREAAIVSPIAGTTRDRIDVPVIREGIPYVLTDTAGLTETDDVVEQMGVDRAEQAIAAAQIVLWLGNGTPPRDAIWLYPRADQPDRSDPPPGRTVVARSDPASIDHLWKTIGDAAAKLLPRADMMAFNRRQRDACSVAIDRLTTDARDPLIVAEEVRAAARSLGSILGIDATEAMLDALFGRFCIGK